MDEFELIKRYFAPLAAQAGGRIETYSLLDDAASFTPNDKSLVFTTDMLVAGIHFFASDPAFLVARKALAVNVSDLIAKGARPIAYLLSLSLPASVDEDWIAEFAAGLGAAGDEYGCALAGGDTTSMTSRGPIVINIALIGEAAPTGMVRRGTALPGDAVYVTGPIGDAALGLRLRLDTGELEGATMSPEDVAYLLQRYLLPRPRIELVDLIAQNASAAMDVSDGLIGDFAKLCTASGVAGSIRAAAVPLSLAARHLVDERADLLETALTGGDDYVVLLCVRPHQVAAFEQAALAFGGISRVGDIEAGAGVHVLDDAGAAMSFTSMSYNHFAKQGRRC